MKRWSVVVVSMWAWLLAQPVEAQVRVGVMTGANVSTHTSDELDVNSLSSFVVGATAVVPIGWIVSMRTDFLLIRKGANPVWEMAGVTGGLRMDYVEIPLLAQVGLPWLAPLHPTLYGGPAPSFATRCDLEFAFHGVPEPRTCEENGAEISTFEWGLVVGGSVGVDVGRARLIVDARYNHGVRDINEHPVATTKHRSVTLMGGVAFALGRS